MTDGLTIRRLLPADEALVLAASGLFDAMPQRQLVRRFLDAPGHHLLLAELDGAPAGFVSGIELMHPDKDPEMFVYELGVEEEFRRRGIGTALVAALAQLARQRACRGMWVLVDTDNGPALGTYRAAGASREEVTSLLEWQFGVDPPEAAHGAGRR